MSTSSENSPFILRFSKTMIKPNPKAGRGGKPRIAEGAAANPFEISERMEKGFSFYRSFEYNNGLPVFNRMVLKSGSLSKSLRYHFFQTTGLKPVGSISSDTLIFSLADRHELNRVSGVMKYSRNKAFRASFSHMERIDCITPESKMRASLPDIAGFSGNTLYLATFCRAAECGPIINFLKYGLNAEAAEEIILGGAPFIRLTMRDIKQAYDTLFTHSLIRSALKEPQIMLYEQYIRHDDLPLECVSTRDFGKSYPSAAVVDSGLSEQSYLKEWELATESFLTGDEKNPRHGTFVSGRLLTNGEKFGGILFLNVEIIPDGTGLSVDRFYQCMDDVLSRYHTTVKVYNISLGTDTEIGDAFSLPAYILDTLQRKYDVLFVISSGNTEALIAGGRITSPADSVLALTVGSVSHVDTNFQKKNTPSLFSRHGPGPALFIKPDVASFGGAHEERFGKLRPVGVFSIGARNELAEDCGTSHAAPVIASLAAKLYHRYSHVFKSPFMAKAMIIHYTFLESRSEKPDIYTGYGVTPENVSDSDRQVTYLHSGTAPSGRMVELPDIPIPPDMFEGGHAAGEIVITLTYKPATDISYPHYYCMQNIEASLGYYEENRWKTLVTTSGSAVYEGKSHDKDSNEISRWQPVKVIRCLLKNKKLPDMLSLRVMPARRDFYSLKEDIDYNIVISFVHNEKNLYQCLRKTNSKYEDILEPASGVWKTCG